MKKLLFSAFLLLSLSITSQNKLNDYQYAIVSSKFDFLKKTDQYQTSSLAKFLLNKIGFKAYLSSDKLLNKINSNRCDFLFVNILSDSGFFTTKNVVEFKDCNGIVVFKSREGKSKKKDYGKAYHEAIRNAFKDPSIVGYKFSKKKNIIVSTRDTSLIGTPKTTVKEKPIYQDEVTVVKEIKSNKKTLYAQLKKNGYQLIDTSPKVIYTILKTSTSNLYIIKNKDGILYLKNSKWIAEYYENGKMMQKELQIKF